MRHRRLRRQASRPGSAARRASRAWSTAATTQPGISMIAGRRDRLGPRGRQPRAPARGRLGARRTRSPAASPPPTRTATTGISHTRWATHGPANDTNAHPHLGGDDRGRTSSTTASSRTMPLLKDQASGRPGGRLQQRHRYRGDRATDRPSPERRPGRPRRCAQALTLGSRAPTSTGGGQVRIFFPGRSSARASAAHAWRRRGRVLLRQRIPALIARRAACSTSRTARCRVTPAGTTFILPDGTELDADRRDRLGPGDRREGRLRDLHAQGDPRAADGLPRRSPAAPSRRRRRPRRRRSARRGDPARRRRHRRRLRHELPRSADRRLRDRGVGAHPGGDGDRLGVPLPHPVVGPGTSSSRSPSRARPPTRWPRCASPASAGRPCSR